MSAVCLNLLAPLDRATAMNMTIVLLGFTAGLTTVKTTQQERQIVAWKNPAF